MKKRETSRKENWILKNEELCIKKTHRKTNHAIHTKKKSNLTTFTKKKTKTQKHTCTNRI